MGGTLPTGNTLPFGVEPRASHQGFAYKESARGGRSRPCLHASFRKGISRGLEYSAVLPKKCATMVLQQVYKRRWDWRLPFTPDHDRLDLQPNLHPGRTDNYRSC